MSITAPQREAIEGKTPVLVDDIVSTGKTMVEATRQLVHAAARKGDAGEPDALPSILACKAAAGDAAVRIANEAMTLCGGAGYRDNGRLARILRDARASHVMAPTTDMLKTWVGRALLGLPLL